MTPPSSSSLSKTETTITLVSLDRFDWFMLRFRARHICSLLDVLVQPVPHGLVMDQVREVALPVLSLAVSSSCSLRLLSAANGLETSADLRANVEPRGNILGIRAPVGLFSTDPIQIGS